MVEELMALERFEDDIRVLLLGRREEHQLEMLLKILQHRYQTGAKLDVDLYTNF